MLLKQNYQETEVNVDHILKSGMQQRQRFFGLCIELQNIHQLHFGILIDRYLFKSLINVVT